MNTARTKKFKTTPKFDTAEKRRTDRLETLRRKEIRQAKRGSTRQSRMGVATLKTLYTT